jgi:lysine 2,3-aminomutase
MKFEFKPAPKPASISDQEWFSWTWQLQKSLKTQSDFSRWFTLSSEENQAFSEGEELFNIRTTPYYASLVRPGENDPLRRILMPTASELSRGLQSMLDPLGELKNNPVPRVIHRYPDRALFLVTDICSVYCRYCTRKHFTGQEQAFIKESDYQRALEYFRTHTGLREVILSGGDPLTLGDAQLERVLRDLRTIEHIEIIRVGTRMPVVCPMRVSESTVKMMRKYAPVFLMTHFNHPREVTLEAKTALELFVDNGIPVMNQMVLLNGVNNSPAIVQALSRRLLYLRVKPYYMFQCDPSEGTDHLRTSIEESMRIQRELWGNLSGLAMPNLSMDIPDGGGKAALVPEFETSREEGVRHYKGWDGVEAEYRNPPPEQRILPADAGDYQAEWDLLRAGKMSPETADNIRMPVSGSPELSESPDPCSRSFARPPLA